MSKTYRIVLNRATLYAACLAIASQTASAASIIDDFESYAPGSFPTPTWLDVAAVLPEPAPLVNAPWPTQALQSINALGVSQGIYTPVPVSSSYSLFADLRTVQYADTSLDPQNAGPATDWSMQLAFAQVGVSNFDGTPQAEVYASSQAQGWRLYLDGSNGGPTVDIDLGVTAALGIWYSVELQIDAITGSFRSIIKDAASGTLLDGLALRRRRVA